MNRGQIMNIILVVVLVAIVYLVYMKTQVPSGTQSEKMLKELYSIKDALIPKKYIENYRSNSSNGLTIVGTMMEQIVDIMIAILKQNPTREMIDGFVQNATDAATIAEAIETVGARIVVEISKNDVIRKTLEERSGNTHTIYLPDSTNLNTIYVNGAKNGLLEVLKDESKYDKYYDALKNVIMDMERRTNPDVTDERFPTKEVFKSRMMPEIISNIKQRF